MAIEIFEAPDSPEITLTSIKRKYLVRGTESEYEAHAALVAYTNHTEVANGVTLYRNGCSLALIEKANDLWTGSADWGVETSDSSDPQYRVAAVQFDTSGATTRITQSIRTRATYKADDVEEAPNFHGGIGYNGESFDGCEITVPQFAWTETHEFGIEQITWAYVAALTNATGKVTSGSFRGFAAGEVLFLGASGGNPKNEKKADVQFRFAAAPNVRDMTVAGVSGVAKQGWDYVWVYFEEAEDTKTHRRYKKPVAVYVEQVYESAAFSALGI